MVRKCFDPAMLGLILLIGVSVIACVRQGQSNRQSAQKLETSTPYQIALNQMPG